MLDCDFVVERFTAGARLPRDYGAGFDERVVEYPWLISKRPCGRVLDAGSTLNHAHVLDRILPLVDRLDIVTLEPESESFPERGISYVYADLRDLPFEDESYDTVVSLSTLEHVGMDNRRFGSAVPHASDPSAERDRAVAELGRVLKPGGRLLASVPYGRREDHGWFEQFDAGMLKELLEPLTATIGLTVFAYSKGGWQRSTLREAGRAQYHDFTATGQAASDLAPAARGVACISAAV